MTTSELDSLGEAVDAGVSLWLGCLPSVDAPVAMDAGRDRLRRLWSQLGFPPAQLGASVVATPSCGLAGASPDHARRVLTVLRDLGRWLVDEAAA